MPSSRHRRSFSSVKNEPASPLDGYGSRALSAEGADMESADRYFLEYGLAAAVGHGTTVLHANASANNH